MAVLISNCTLICAIMPDEVSPAGDPAQLMIRKSGVSDMEISFGSAAFADLYRVVRGEIGIWYRHYADDSLGIGSCDNGPGSVFLDADDLSQPGDFYYLVIGVRFIGCEGPYGNDSLVSPPSNVTRPVKLPSSTCP